MKRNRILRLISSIFLFLFSLSLTSCLMPKSNRVVNSEPINRNDFVSAEIVGELSKTKYYNKHDEWDFSSINVKVIYGEDEYLLSMYDSHISFETDPVTPTDGVKEVSIINCKYIDYLEVEHDIASRSFEVTISNYPYIDDSYEFLGLSLAIVLTTISIVTVIVVSYKKHREVIVHG